MEFKPDDQLQWSSVQEQEEICFKQIPGSNMGVFISEIGKALNLILQKSEIAEPRYNTPDSIQLALASSFAYNFEKNKLTSKNLNILKGDTSA